MNKVHKFEVWYESYPVIRSGTEGGRMVLFDRDGRTLCRKIVEVKSLDNYHIELMKGLEEDGFSNSVLRSRKVNDDGSTDKEFEELRTKEFYNKFPLLKEALSKLKLNQ